MSVTHVGFSTPRSFNPVSLLVRKLTHSRASHVWFLFWDADFSLDMVMEAHELGFRLIPLERFKKSNRIVGIFTPKEDTTDAMRWAARHLGSAYDFGGLLGMAWVLLGRVFKRSWRNPLNSPRAMFCSELAVRVLQKAGTPWVLGLLASRVTPQDLLTLFEKEFPRARH